MSRLVHKKYPASISQQNCVWWLGIIGKSKRQLSIATLRLKHLISTLGYLLTLAASLGLWCGIYAAISTTIPDNLQNYADVRIGMIPRELSECDGHRSPAANEAYSLVGNRYIAHSLNCHVSS